jgi:hypothetical protein
MLNLVFYDVNRLTKKMFESNKDLLPPSIFIRHIVLLVWLQTYNHDKVYLITTNTIL